MVMLIVDVQKPVARVTLDRPDTHNAFNDELIPLVTDAFKELGSVMTSVSLFSAEAESRFAPAPISTG